MDGWIGVDFDRTLSRYEGQFHDGIGPPIDPMLTRVINWVKEGREVRILTARVASCHEDREIQRKAIADWCKTHVGVALPVTSEKDKNMIELWDDNAVRVERNTGKRLSPSWIEEDKE